MSLYFDAVTVLTAPSSGGSFKSRIYSAKNLRATPSQIYALVVEAAKWDRVLAEVIERAGLLNLERKLTPLLALLLVHDHLISKNGIAAPAAHPLRQAVERHKVRLKAELAKARVRRGCASLADLKATLLREKREANGISGFVYPRWVRINNIRSSFEEQMQTTFSAYKTVDSLAGLAVDSDDRAAQRLLFVDPNIPDLIAIPYGADITSTPAYKKGEIILQDKASCFPAYLLLGNVSPQNPWQGDLVDGCAAPGNKTTHMASILAKQKETKPRNQIFSMDASKPRSKILQKMVSLASSDSTVTILPGQDFLALDPTEERFANVTGLLLDPSCSGSGIVGRDDIPQLTLPKAPRPKENRRKQVPAASNTSSAPTDENDIPSGIVDSDRLTKLSNLQARIVEHALSFPSATHVTYSTCSIHLIENEAVVERLLASDVARERGWRLLRRDEQPDGLRKWKHRGVSEDRTSTAISKTDTPMSVNLSQDDLEACLRCWSGDAEGLGGFFVAGFVRDQSLAGATKEKRSDNGSLEDDEEWGGFSD
ncbi:hypothetical protein N7470_002683 [Penicillium chermesinum]|nr:hypothetical protein N7470_002683 [Penicillium chermesinum]